MISRSVRPRPPRQRARAPCLENKNSAPQARFRSQTPSKQAKVHAFWLPKQQCNQPQPPQPPHWSTRPTGPVDHPADPPTHRAPHPHPTLALGLRTLGAPGPPPGPGFPVFVFSRPPACSESPGPALTERSKTLRPRPRPRRAACTRRTWTSPRVPSQRPRSTTPSSTRSWRCRDLVWACRLGVSEHRGLGGAGSGRRGLIFGFYPLFDFCSGQFYGTVSALGFTDFLLFSCIFMQLLALSFRFSLIK